MNYVIRIGSLLACQYEADYEFDEYTDLWLNHDFEMIAQSRLVNIYILCFELTEAIFHSHLFSVVHMEDVSDIGAITKAVLQKAAIHSNPLPATRLIYLRSMLSYDPFMMDMECMLNIKERSHNLINAGTGGQFLFYGIQTDYSMFLHTVEAADGLECLRTWTAERGQEVTPLKISARHPACSRLDYYAEILVAQIRPDEHFAQDPPNAAV